MNLSLVICTRNRALQLQKCLEAVRVMSKPPGFELVVVDNGSKDQTVRILETFAASVDFPVRCVYESRSGLGRARNAGWRAADGDIIAFTDDDCYVDEKFAISICSVFDSRSELSFIGGRILLHDPGDLRVTILESFTERLFSPHTFIPAGAIQGANFAFRREILDKSKGFDDLMGAGTLFPAEDIEMVARLSAMSKTGAYCPDVLVYHHHGRKQQSDLFRLMRSYDYGRGAYFVAMFFLPTIRFQALKAWVKSIRKAPFRQSIREIVSGMKYFMSRTALKYSKNTIKVGD